jgi:hypothetical protein
VYVGRRPFAKWEEEGAIFGCTRLGGGVEVPDSIALNLLYPIPPPSPHALASVLTERTLLN